MWMDNQKFPREQRLDLETLIGGRRLGLDPQVQGRRLGFLAGNRPSILYSGKPPTAPRPHDLSWA